MDDIEKNLHSKSAKNKNMGLYNNIYRKCGKKYNTNRKIESALYALNPDTWDLNDFYVSYDEELNNNEST